MGTIYATSPMRNPPVPHYAGRKSSFDRTQLVGSPIYEESSGAVTLAVSDAYIDFTLWQVACLITIIIIFTAWCL